MKKEKDNVNDVAIYIFPNAEHSKVFVKDYSDNLVETKFHMPKWVLTNVMKRMKQNEMESSQKKMNHDKDNTVRDLRKDVVGIKKDMKAIKKDIHLLCELVKMIKK